MIEPIQTIVDIAGSLEKEGLTKSAGYLDKLAERYSLVKKAQYVGVQGYWIRNRRCWENCYRQKRASKPGTAAQEVWFECHKEYLASINNPDSGWEKYAADLSETTLKTASATGGNEVKFFNQQLRKNIKKANSIGDAVFASLEQGSSRHQVAALKVAEDIAGVAEKMANKGRNKDAKKLAEVADAIVVEASGWGATNPLTGNPGGALSNAWEGLKGLFGGQGGRMKNILLRLENILNIAGNYNQQLNEAVQGIGSGNMSQPVTRAPAQQQLQPQPQQASVAAGNTFNLKGKIQKEAADSQGVMQAISHQFIPQLTKELNYLVRLQQQFTQKGDNNAASMLQRALSPINTYVQQWAGVKDANQALNLTQNFTANMRQGIANLSSTPQVTSPQTENIEDDTEQYVANQIAELVSSINDGSTLTAILNYVSDRLEKVNSTEIPSTPDKIKASVNIESLTKLASHFDRRGWSRVADGVDEITNRILTSQMTPKQAGNAFEVLAHKIASQDPKLSADLIRLSSQMKESLNWMDRAGNFLKGRLNSKNFGVDSMLPIVGQLETTLQSYRDQRNQLVQMLDQIVTNSTDDYQKSVATNLKNLTKNLNQKTLDEIKKQIQRLSPTYQKHNDIQGHPKKTLPATHDTADKSVEPSSLKKSPETGNGNPWASVNRKTRIDKILEHAGKLPSSAIKKLVEQLDLEKNKRNQSDKEKQEVGAAVVDRLTKMALHQPYQQNLQNNPAWQEILQIMQTLSQTDIDELTASLSSLVDTKNQQDQQDQQDRQTSQDERDEQYYKDHEEIKK